MIHQIFVYMIGQFRVIYIIKQQHCSDKSVMLNNDNLDPCLSCIQQSKIISKIIYSVYLSGVTRQFGGKRV